MWKDLQIWFSKNKRSFPWREDSSPYRVWISEVMLQQTRASVVVEYFERWMDRFPTIEALAAASEAEVIKAWEGLGYYSRARNLQKTAKLIDCLPQTRKELESLPGIGAYTAGAILSFAFGQKAVALDGNVERVLSRVLLFEKDVGRHRKELALWLEKHLTGPDVMEGLIELGATVCGKNPKCMICPLKDQCKARGSGKELSLPFKAKRAKITKLHRRVYCIEAEGHFLVKKGEDGRVMAGLYEFPYCEVEPEETCMFVHHFTKYKVHLYPKHCIWAAKIPVMNYEWVKFGELEKLPFSSGHRRLIHEWLY